MNQYLPVIFVSAALLLAITPALAGSAAKSKKPQAARVWTCDDVEYTHSTSTSVEWEEIYANTRGTRVECTGSIADVYKKWFSDSYKVQVMIGGSLLLQDTVFFSVDKRTALALRLHQKIRFSGTIDFITSPLGSFLMELNNVTIR